MALHDDSRPLDPDEPQYGRPGEGEPDERLYLTDATKTRVTAKTSGERAYCYYRFPGEEHFHLLMTGELYVAHGDQKICLQCALRLGYLTPNRLHWQTRQRRIKRPVV